MHLLKLFKDNSLRQIFFFIVFFFIYVINTQYIVGQKRYIVVIDAGHGGKDSGASKGKYREKKISLSISLKVGKLLSKNKNIKVIYTRKKDVFIELHKRATIANKNNADLFISIHCNSNKSKEPYGTETYILGLNGSKENMEIAKKENAVILLEDNYKSNYNYDPNSPESVIGLSVIQEDNLEESLNLASIIQTNFSKLKRYNRSVKQANFLVLRETIMPSILIELGFLSNKQEARFLNSKTGQYKMSKAISNAIQRYIEQIKINTIIKANKLDNKKLVKSKKERKNNKNTKTKFEFFVQIAASKKYIPPKPYNFRGLKNVKVKKIDGYYKYFYASSHEYKIIKEHLKKVCKSGIKGAFIVAFKNGKKIPLFKALKNI